MGLNYLARGTYQRELGQDFYHAMGQSTVSEHLKQFLDAFSDSFFRDWVRWPEGEDLENNKKA
jgi:hypothetical protein